MSLERRGMEARAGFPHRLLRRNHRGGGVGTHRNPRAQSAQDNQKADPRLE